MSEDAEHRGRGQPTKYKPEYCEMVVEDMAKGFSLTAFAGLIGVSKTSIKAWVVEHADFSAAVSRAKVARLRFWEELNLKAAESGPGGPGAQTLIVFGLKNTDDEEWVDKTKQEHTGNIMIGSGGDAEL